MSGEEDDDWNPDEIVDPWIRGKLGRGGQKKRGVVGGGIKMYKYMIIINYRRKEGCSGAKSGAKLQGETSQERER